MRTVKGYAFIPSFEYYEPIFGKRVHSKSDGNYESFQLNGMIPYDYFEDTEKSAKEFIEKRKQNIKVKLAKLEMDIVENEKESVMFSNESSLIVIMDSEYGEKLLLGPIVEGKPAIYSDLPGALLYQNGFRAYESCEKEERTPFERAIELFKAVNQRRKFSATIARFNLEILKEV